MSEMLGNQYFMARNYFDAIKEFEPIYSKSKKVRRKLIICYVQINLLDKALDTFYSLVKEDVQFIVDADPIFDDCPCQEIIKKFEKTETSPNATDSNLANGILWLYCDPKKSIEFLEKVLVDYPLNYKVEESLEIIANYISN